MPVDNIVWGVATKDERETYLQEIEDQYRGDFFNLIDMIQNQIGGS